MEAIEQIEVVKGEEGLVQEPKNQLDCRMYEAEFPEPDDLVMVRVNRLNEIGAFVSLLEFNNIEGIILLSELSRRRMRTVHKHIRVGKQEVLQVLRVDPEKGYIDLSKKNLKAEDVTKHQEWYNSSKTVHSIMRHLAETLSIDTVELYKAWGWQLYKMAPHALDIFKKAVTHPDVLDGVEGITPAIKDELLKAISHRLACQPKKLQANIDVTCFTEEGVDAIIPSLQAGVVVGKQFGIKINLISTPTYSMVLTHMDEREGVAQLRSCIDVVKQEIEKRHGSLKIRAEPYIVS